MDNHQPQTTEQVPHSGDLPEGVRETPVQDFDNTTLSQAVEKDLITTPDSAADLITTNAPEKKKPNVAKRVIWALGGAAAATAVAVSAVFAGGALNQGDGSKNEPVPANPSDSSEGAEVPTANPAEVILSNPDRISPDVVAGMTLEQLNELATITTEEAPTPEAYSKEFTKVLDAWMNSGNTEGEFTPFAKAAKGEYEAALGEKYDPIFASGLYAEGVKTGFDQLHKLVLNPAQTSRLIESDVPFSYGVVYKESTLINGSVDSTAEPFTIDVTADIANNYEESGVTKITNETNVLTTSTWELSVVNNGGKLQIVQLQDK